VLKPPKKKYKLYTNGVKKAEMHSLASTGLADIGASHFVLEDEQLTGNCGSLEFVNGRDEKWECLALEVSYLHPCPPTFLLGPSSWPPFSPFGVFPSSFLFKAI
jgi:hypothetical protein